MPLQTVDKIWMDGELVDWADAKIHVLTHSLHYGTGVFEGIRAYETDRGAAVFRLTDHMVRLFESAKILMIDIPYSVEQLVDATLETLNANALKSCYIRPLVYLGYGEMGLNPLPCPVNVSISMWPWGTYLGDEGVQNGIRAKVSSWKRQDPNSLPPTAKATGAYINSSLAKVEAMKAGYEEAIILNPEGKVAEGSGENIFVVKKGEILMPPASDGALQGITKDTVVAVARAAGMTVRESSLVRADLYLADEVFCCGTAAEVVPISSIDDRDVGSGKPGPITRQIQEEYKNVVTGKAAGYEHWLEYAR